jgi:hypothetical protein
MKIGNWKRGVAMGWVNRLFGKRKRDEELEDEVRGHLEMAARDRVERGVEASEAERAARREFGNIELVKEVTRILWRTRDMGCEGCASRLGLRRLRY